MPDLDPGQPRTTRSGRRLVLRTCAAALGALGLVVAGAASWRPSWYRPAAIRYDLLRHDKRALADWSERISQALARGQALDVELTDAQLNRWVAAREEIGPEFAVTWPGQLHDPLIAFLDGQRVRVAARLSLGSWDAVVTCIGALRAREDELELRLHSVRVGALPVPSGWLTGRLGAWAPEPVRIGRAGTLHVTNRWRWPGVERRFRIMHLAITAGRLQMRLVPL